jgi:hypothetical protein
MLTVESTPSGATNVNNKYVGVTPMSYPLVYDQEVEQDKTNVTYWETEPGMALFVSIVSLGLYLPFSMIPVDTKTAQVPLDNYRNNSFVVTVDSAGYEQWKEVVVAKGEKTLHLQAQLAPHNGQR